MSNTLISPNGNTLTLVATVKTTPIEDSAPKPIRVNPDNSQILIDFGPEADASVVSNYSLSVVHDAMVASGVKRLTISSSARTPQKQAGAMFDKIHSRDDLERERSQYGPAGQAALDAFETGKKAGQTDAAIQSNMANAITKAKAAGKDGLKHVSDPSTTNVIDISQRSIPKTERSAFVSALQIDSRIDQKRFFKPPKDKDVYHIEIPQPHKE